jgi:hypothetical protein
MIYVVVVIVVLNFKFLLIYMFFMSLILLEKTQKAGHLAMGDYYVERGEFTSAVKSFMRGW